MVKPIFENVIDMIGGLMKKKKKLKVVPTKYVSQSIKDIQPAIRGRKRGPFLRPAFIGPFVPEKARRGRGPGKKTLLALAEAERLRGEEDALLREERKAKREAKERPSVVSRDGVVSVRVPAKAKKFNIAEARRLLGEAKEEEEPYEGEVKAEEPAGRYYYDPILREVFPRDPREEPPPLPLPLLDPVEFPYGAKKDGTPAKKRGPKTESPEKAEPKPKLKVVPKLSKKAQEEALLLAEGIAPLRAAEAKKAEKAKKASSKESSPAVSPKFESPEVSPRGLTASGRLRKKKLKRV